MMEDYLALKKKIKDENLEERSKGLDYRQYLEEQYQPVVASNENMSQSLIKELKPTKLGLEELTKNVHLESGIKRDADSQPKSNKGELLVKDLGPIAQAFISKYMDSELKSKKIDTTFGIRYDYNNDSWKIGNKHVKLNTDDSMQVGDDYYDGTPGFWNLVTNKNPDANYTADDYKRYKELLWETSALHQHYDPDNQYPRASGSKKWKKF